MTKAQLRLELMLLKDQLATVTKERDEMREYLTRIFIYGEQRPNGLWTACVDGGTKAAIDAAKGGSNE